jgi:hypothetical protein
MRIEVLAIERHVPSTVRVTIPIEPDLGTDAATADRGRADR